MSDLVNALRAIVGPAHVLTDLAEREYHSMDAFWTDAVCAAVVRPGTQEEAIAVVGAAVAAGYAIVPRGGGMSYTSGYVPTRERSITLDATRLQRISEINEADGHVTAECGVTWKALNEALAARGLRTPYFGPLSGAFATVGGTLSNNSMFLASGRYGTAAENVLSVKVALADGRVLLTGSRANRGGNPFHRHFGPDLTGLFLSDAGALGLKLEVTLRLIPTPSQTRFASFAFDTFDDMFRAQAEIARYRSVAECYAFDPFLNSEMASLKDTKTAVQTVKDVVLAAPSVAKGIGDVLGMALAGPHFLRNVAWSLHIVTEANEAATAEAEMATARALAAERGREIADTIPRVIRAAPFRHVGEFLVGHGGERWVPIHACLPLSKVSEAYARTQAYFTSRRETLDRFQVRTSLLTAVSGTDYIFEPAFYYPDRLTAFQLRNLLPADRERFASRPEVKGASEAVISMLRDLSVLYLEMGAAHQQIGKFYPYKEALDPASYEVLSAFKAIVDPKGLMNPGALGLK